jgi:hypothetical protein
MYLRRNTSKQPKIKSEDKENTNRQSPDNQDEQLLLEQKFLLSKREAQAAAPIDMAVCGEEDPGEGAEFLVDENTRR